jgi:prepilin-type N-terminal cleavage/methylation domain-containing protein
MKRAMRLSMKNSQSGLTLVELMIALTVLAVGLAGIMAIVIAALFSNNHNRTDTSATWLSVMVIQQMGEIPAGTNTVFTIKDCAGTTWNVNTAAGGATLRGTNNSPSWVANDIDFTAASGYGAAPGNGYGMLYQACGTNGSNGIKYDVRWNIANNIEQTKTVIVGAKIIGSASGQQNYYFSMPVQMKTILGS